jgi:hypothetical protein
MKKTASGSGTSGTKTTHRRGDLRRHMDREWNRVVAISGKTVDQAKAPVVHPSAQRPLQRLGVTAAQLAQAPEIASILRMADGGIKQCLQAMRLSEDATIRQFLAKHDSLSAFDRAHLPIEAICIAAGVDCRHLLGAVTIALEVLNVSLVKILTVSSHAKIVAARIKFGQLPYGDRDRQALDQAVGFLPSPKAMTIINKAVYGSGQNAMDQQRRLNGGDSDEDEAPVGNLDYDLDRIFPPANKMQDKLQTIRQRMLPDDGKKRPN